MGFVYLDAGEPAYYQPPCPMSFHSDAFAKLLESGDLSMSSIKVDGINMSFQNLLTKICFHHHFSGKGFDGTGRPESLLTCGSHFAPFRATLASPTCFVVVVERVDSCASLYSRSIQGHHVCLLVKKVRLHEGNLLTPCHHATHTMSPPSSPCRLCNTWLSSVCDCSIEVHGTHVREDSWPWVFCWVWTSGHP